MKTIAIDKIAESNKSDKRISMALMSSFVILTIQYFLLIYFNINETRIGSSIQVLSKILVGIIYLYALPSVLKRSKTKFFSIYLLFLFIFLLHYIIFPENRNYIIELLFPFFFICLPSFIYAISIKDIVLFKDFMRKTSYIVFAIGFLISLLVFIGESSIGTYSMSLSYYMLFPTIMFLDELLDEFSIKSLIGTMISILVVLALGSRGAILCIIVFFFLKIIRPDKLSNKKMLFYMSLIGIGFIVLIYFYEIMLYLYDLLTKFGINSRTLLLFLEGGVHLSGRDRIYNNLISEVLNKPIMGIGIGGDRKIIGSYAHNLFLEIIVNFGLIVGIFLCVGLILLIIRSLMTKNKLKYNLIIIWLSLGFVSLMISSSYLIDIKFWIFMGLMLNILQKGNNISVNKI